MRRALVPIIILVCVPLFAQQQQTQPAQPVQAAPPVTPDQLWNALLQGNQYFVAGSISYNLLKEERAQLRDTQLPPITVLACSDSRVPPELIFNQSLGALFVIRTAGNVADEFGVASIEYAIANNWTRLIVVLGHENCGAVKASLGGADPTTPALKALATRIRTSFAGIPYDSVDKSNLKRAIDANTRASAAQLLAYSTLIRDAVLTERVKIVTAYYELGSGEVKKVE
jgi:carbonic anhydrase